MTITSKPLALAAILGLLPAGLLAQSTVQTALSATPFHGPISQLEGQTFSVQGLKVAILSYHSGSITPSGFKVRVENPTSQFITVAWMDLALVDANGEQIDLAEMYPERRAPEAQVRIAPGAHVNRTFWVVGSTNSVKLPAKLYFEGQCLAELMR